MRISLKKRKIIYYRRYNKWESACMYEKFLDFSLFSFFFAINSLLSGKNIHLKEKNEKEQDNSTIQVSWIITGHCNYWNNRFPIYVFVIYLQIMRNRGSRSRELERSQRMAKDAKNEKKFRDRHAILSKIDAELNDCLKCDKIVFWPVLAQQVQLSHVLFKAHGL